METPEYRMSYDDRLTEEAWAIAKSKKAYEERGSKWEPWKLNLVTVSIADILSGKKPGLEIVVPDDENYYWARQKVDSDIAFSQDTLKRLKRVPIIYCDLDEEYINPWWTHLNTSWNGMRDYLSVDHFFFLTGIPEEELKTVFHYDPENLQQSAASYFGGYFGFAEGGRQRLTDLVNKPIAFIRCRTEGRRSGSWDLSSKEIVVPKTAVMC